MFVVKGETEEEKKKKIYMKLFDVTKKNENICCDNTFLSRD